MERSPLLFLEDDEALSASVTDYLETKGFQVYHTGTCAEAKSLLDEYSFNVALIDMRLPDGEGTTVIESIIQMKLNTKIILVTGYGSTERIKKYLRQGLFDFLEKPFRLEKLLKRVNNANHLFQLEYASFAHRISQENHYKLVGVSPQMKKVKEEIMLAAESSSPVLIEGETGTGKELVARNIYLESNRSSQQFISVNCAAVPENLFESEFFGYEKGAFTGANRNKPGYFELATFGILHLDEIGEMPIEFQAKLLRVLEEGRYLKLGGAKEVHVDVRIIASTNKNLKMEVEEKRFREDLYYRIAVQTIRIPPLRERMEDIPVLAEYLWHRLHSKMGKKTISPSISFSDLKNYSWKGNGRELRNHIEKIIIYRNTGDAILPDDMNEKDERENPGLVKPLDDYIRDYVVETLESFDFNKTRAANALGLSLSTLKRKLKNWDVEVKRTI